MLRSSSTIPLLLSSLLIGACSSSSNDSGGNVDSDADADHLADADHFDSTPPDSGPPPDTTPSDTPGDTSTTDSTPSDSSDSAPDGDTSDPCTASGGTVSTALCCASAPDFPNNCATGACGCAPSSSHEVKVCNCPTPRCWNGTDCVLPPG